MEERQILKALRNEMHTTIEQIGDLETLTMFLLTTRDLFLKQWPEHKQMITLIHKAYQQIAEAQFVVQPVNLTRAG